jgi:hypothetical protein
MAGLLEATFKLLKRMYSPEKVAELFYKDSPVLGMIQRQQIGGESWLVPLIYGGVANRSATFSDAIAGSGYRRSLQWNITSSDNFNFAEVGHRAILAAKAGDKASYAQALKYSIDGAILEMKTDISATLWKDGSGLIGQLSAASAGNPTGTITFSSIQALREIGVDARLEVFSDAALTSSVGSVTVTKVDKETGVVTYSGNGASFLANHYVTHKGDANLKFKGINAWLPYGSGRASALAASFFGIARDTDSSWLGGVTHDATGQTIEEALIMAEQKIRTIGGGPAVDLIVMSPKTLAALKLEVTGRFVMGNAPGATANISYRAVQLSSLSGNSVIVEDPFLADGVAYMLVKDTWRLGHMGSDLVNTFNEDGIDALRSPSANSLQIRFYSYMQPFCRCPGWNGVIYNLPTT